MFNELIDTIENADKQALTDPPGKVGEIAKYIVIRLFRYSSARRSLKVGGSPGCRWRYASSDQDVADGTGRGNGWAGKKASK